MKGIAILTASILASSFCNSAFAVDDKYGAVVLRQIGSSGIQGRIFFFDRGNPQEGTTVIGFARGLDPKQTFVSLVYDNGSMPKGPNACLPTDTSLTFKQMVLGVWKVYPNGTATLYGTSKGDAYFPVEDIGTASVRLDTQPGTPLPAQPDPGRFQIKACGAVN